MRPLTLPIHRVEEHTVKLVLMTEPKSMNELLVPWSACTGTSVPWPLMLTDERPDAESVAVFILPVASCHVRVCRSNSPWRYQANGDAGMMNGR
eukprot:496430-Prymnesium_polylepis.1